jgi:uncharacterized protein
MRIRIAWDGGAVEGTLDDTATARAVAGALPISARANTWGDEVYFDVGVRVDKDADAQQVVPAGTICYWVEGTSLALPFGPTPISHGDECRLAAKVNLVGRLEGDPRVLATVRDGMRISVAAVD